MFLVFEGENEKIDVKFTMLVDLLIQDLLIFTDEIHTTSKEIFFESIHEKCLFIDSSCFEDYDEPITFIKKLFELEIARWLENFLMHYLRHLKKLLLIV
jgi:hypothetical protein